MPCQQHSNRTIDCVTLCDNEYTKSDKKSFSGHISTKHLGNSSSSSSSRTSEDMELKIENSSQIEGNEVAVISYSCVTTYLVLCI